MISEKLYIVGIGSSAGGLPAIIAFIQNIKQDEDTAYVIVQHMKFDQDSKLAVILSRETSIPVHVIADNDIVKAGNIYVMPAGYKLKIENGEFKLEPRLETEKINWAINYFFISLANEMKSRAFGVILSGSGTDGAEGVKEIERSGGIVLVQDPDTAQFNGMPVNTIHKDHPDYVLSPEAMPALIAELQKNKNPSSLK